MKTTVIKRCDFSHLGEDFFKASEGGSPNDASASIRQFSRFLNQKVNQLENEYRNLEVGQGPQEDHSSFRLDRAQLVKILTQILDELPPQETTLFSLYYCEGLNFREIGEVLGYPELKIIELFTEGIKKVATKMQFKADN